MSGIFHLLLRFKLEKWSVFITSFHYFSTHEHSQWCFIDFSSSNQECFWIFNSNLYHLKVMRKFFIVRKIYLFVFTFSFVGIEKSYAFVVFLKDKKLFRKTIWFKGDCVTLFFLRKLFEHVLTLSKNSLFRINN